MNKNTTTPMNQNLKKKTRMIPAISIIIMLVAVTLSSVGFDQTVTAAIENNDNMQSLQDESITSSSSSFSSATDKTIRLTGGEPSFVPSTININTGEKIIFVNVDGTDGGMPHAVVSVNDKTGVPDGTFDSGLLKTGDRFEVQFDKRGIYAYVDSIYHPEMHGIIIVE